MKAYVGWILAVGWIAIAVELHGQSSGFVVAGQSSGVNNYSYDFVPDTMRFTHVMVNGYYPSEFDSLPIDLDGDLGTDCRFIWSCVEDHGFYIADMYLDVAHGTQVACSMGTNLEFPFQIGDTIVPSLHWVDGPAFPALLHRTYHYFPTHDTVEHVNWPLQSIRYAGLRILHASDTCYTWLEFVLGGTFPQIELTVMALAAGCDQSAATASMSPVDSHMEVFPNPAMERLAVRFQALRGGNYQVRVVGSLGQETYSQSAGMRIGNHSLDIDVSAWPQGAYYLMVEGNGQRWFRQINIMR